MIDDPPLIGLLLLVYGIFVIVISTAQVETADRNPGKAFMIGFLWPVLAVMAIPALIRKAFRKTGFFADVWRIIREMVAGWYE